MSPSRLLANRAPGTLLAADAVHNPTFDTLRDHLPENPQSAKQTESASAFIGVNRRLIPKPYQRHPSQPKSNPLVQLLVLTYLK